MIYHVLGILSQIYCNGPILEAVHKAHLYKDSKYFVDMALKTDPVSTLTNFYKSEAKYGPMHNDIPRLKKFIDTHFSEPGSELEECEPPDWIPIPYSFNRISDYHLKHWAIQLNKLWKVLCRQVTKAVRDQPERFSLLYVPNRFIIPGGRFREFYYWDSYWIVKGLLFSEMYDTARNMIENLLYLVDNYGFIPNGGRIYYMNRSQPPMLIAMVYEYYVATGDIQFMTRVIPTLEKEFQFWIKNRSYKFIRSLTNGSDGKSSETFNVFQYRATLTSPRPESYIEDLELVQNITSIADRETVWSDIASAAETGWDFSSRWFAHSGPNAFDLHSIRTHSIIPVDLNAFMCMNARMLASLSEMSGNVQRTLEYQRWFLHLKRAMHKIHWNETAGIWYDFDIGTKRHVSEYYVSNTMPLFAQCFYNEEEPFKAFQYMQNIGAFNFSRGLPTSLIDSPQQWDAENAWPPMVHIVIEGFRKTGEIKLMNAAKKIAIAWLDTAYQGYIKSHSMFEKYNVTSGSAFAGSGGEYEVQKGFGWTNGVILDLMARYACDIPSHRDTKPNIYLYLFVMFCIVTVFLCVLLIAAISSTIQQFDFSKFFPNERDRKQSVHCVQMIR